MNVKRSNSAVRGKGRTTDDREMTSLALTSFNQMKLVGDGLLAVKVR